MAESHELKPKTARDEGNGISDEDHQKEIRIFMDGAFDLMHFGHMNAFRLAKSLGTQLIVGVNSDESITECKGPPLMNDEDRMTMVQSCKFVDQVIPNCPYIMNQEYLDWVVREHKIDFVVHGDDPCIVDGKDVYATAKESGKFRTIPRTEGVSTTDIVGRILSLVKENPLSKDVILGSQSKFLTTTRLLQLFSSNNPSTPRRDMKVVYMDGAWDLFHPGHVAILKAAKEVRIFLTRFRKNVARWYFLVKRYLSSFSIFSNVVSLVQRGDYLIVGVHSDTVVNRRRGRSLPLLNLHERVLSVLGCRFVDDVLIDSPYQISSDMVSTLNIKAIFHGTSSDGTDHDVRYKYAKEAGLFSVLQSPCDYNVQNVANRIYQNQDAYEAKFERKMKAETDFYQEKHNGSKPVL